MGPAWPHRAAPALLCSGRAHPLLWRRTGPPWPPMPCSHARPCPPARPRAFKWSPRSSFRPPRTLPRPALPLPRSFFLRATPPWPSGGRAAAAFPALRALSTLTACPTIFASLPSASYARSQDESEPRRAVSAALPSSSQPTAANEIHGELLASSLSTPIERPYDFLFSRSTRRSPPRPQLTAGAHRRRAATLPRPQSTWPVRCWAPQAEPQAAAGSRVVIPAHRPALGAGVPPQPAKSAADGHRPTPLCFARREEKKELRVGIETKVGFLMYMC